MIRHWALAMSISLICAATAPFVQAAPEFVNGLALDGAKLDLSGGTDANTGRVGYFSDIYYDPKEDEWHGLSDRGPGGGLIKYETRVQRFRLKIDRDTGRISDFEILQTILFKDESGKPLDGLAPQDPNKNVLGNAFDPEGFVIGPQNHHLYVSDEYGPSLYEFDDKGKRLRTFTTPANLIPRHGSTVDYAGGDPEPNTAGKRTNRGFEGLAISPDGKYLYAMLQSAMLDEGGGNGVCNRIVKFSTATGTAVAQYAYQMEGSSQGRGISALLAINNHEFLVLERNNRGIGVGSTIASPNKKLFRIDINGATDFSTVSFPSPFTACPSGKVKKDSDPFLDITNTLPELGNKLPEKWEGLAIGPRLKNGDYLLVTGTDNDYSVTQNPSTSQQFDVYFRIPASPPFDADPYLHSIFCPLGQTNPCFFNPDDHGGQIVGATLTQDYKLLPGVLYAYRVSAADLQK
jgi:hypothetical protein